MYIYSKYIRIYIPVSPKHPVDKILTLTVFILHPSIPTSPPIKAVLWQVVTGWSNQVENHLQEIVQGSRAPRQSGVCTWGLRARPTRCVALPRGELEYCLGGDEGGEQEAEVRGCGQSGLDGTKASSHVARTKSSGRRTGSEIVGC